ncbi:MFS transporter [Bradyrhizobium sp. CNPSo 4010]|uniref:MFS transporter n=2 Tax=Bradyrhizobium agreste TaxID=2751811 RepID=A0ABS0PJ39_9BRAD|nr:MFS transporter [Bradyrhizobium agreste]
MIGSMTSTLSTRVTVFGLADLRGALAVGFDEGAWITTAIGIGQLIGGISCPYLASVVGPRRMLLAGIAVFFAASLLAPLSPNFSAYIVAQVFGSLGAGTFIPLTIIYISRHVPSHLKTYGFAIFAMNSEFSQNVAASIEGFYADHWSWHWMNWQYCLVLPIMFACVRYGIPQDDPDDGSKLRNLDWPALLYGWLGFGLLYAGIDQGNRLDWIGSGLVSGLLLGGFLAVLAFIVRELTTSHPAIDIRILSRSDLLLFFILLAGFRFIILSIGYIIPVYLQVIQNYRGLQVGTVLLWIALPQFLLVLPLGRLLQQLDPRWTLGLGSALIAAACLIATNLTDQWATGDFLGPQALQAVGQSLALTSLVILISRSITPAQAVAIGSFMQTSRLLGGEIGTAFMQTFVRVREQIHSNLLGLHVQMQDDLTGDRLSAYGRALSSHASEGVAQAMKLLAGAVARQASILAYIDGFCAAAVVAALCWILAAFVRSPGAARGEASSR